MKFAARAMAIFSRLILSYLGIVFLFLAVSLSMIFQLVHFEKVTQSILEVDHRLIDHEKKLTDSLFSEMRFEQKFMVVRDENLYRQALVAREDFNRYLDGVMGIEGPSFLKGLAEAIKARHQAYTALIDEEAKHARSDRPYASSWYQEKKRKVADEILGKLRFLAVQTRQNTAGQMEELKKAGVKSRQLMGGVGVAAFLAVVLLSLFMTRSITHPVSLLIGKTREIAKGVFAGDLHLSGPPEIKELSEAVNFMCARLQALDKMKADFFSTLSHELRTPLTAIKEGTSLLLEGIGGALVPKQTKLLKIISAESNRLIDLVNSSLDLSKMEAGMMSFAFVATDMVSLIHKVAREIEPLALAKKIQVQLEHPNGLPLIKIDVERILQVLRNFMGNAVKFSFEGGTIAVRVSFQEGKFKVAIRDTGPGIPADRLNTIFDKFQQGPPPQDSTYMKGTGLGLAIAKQIVTAHGGRVWAESEPGKGSSFIFALPA